MQVNVAESRAGEVMESFPRTSENYSKAVARLKVRFGTEYLLVEVYMREFLKIHRIRLSSQRDSILILTLSQVGISLKSAGNLRCDESSNSAMLFPLVESCFPEEFCRALNWRVNITQGGEVKRGL
jgi:hypothetical protein